MGLKVINPPNPPMETLNPGTHIYCRGRVYKLVDFKNYTDGKRAVVISLFDGKSEISVEEPFHLVNVTVTLEYVT